MRAAGKTRAGAEHVPGRTFSVAVLAGSVIRAGIATVPFLLPLLLQVGFGLNPFQSGLITFLNTAGAMSMRAWVRHLVRRFRLSRRIRERRFPAVRADGGICPVRTIHAARADCRLSVRLWRACARRR
jgi:hypothetical protein